MAVRAIIFDWMNTIARAEPDRHEQYCQVCREFGIDVSPDKIIRGIYAAATQVPEGLPHKFSESGDPEMEDDSGLSRWALQIHKGRRAHRAGSRNRCRG